MSKQTHTPEPWELDRNGVVVNAEGVVLVALDHVSDPKLRQAIARRIVSCVNAMAGIPDPAAYVAAVRKCEEALEAIAMKPKIEDLSKADWYGIMRGMELTAENALSELESVKGSEHGR